MRFGSFSYGFDLENRSDAALLAGEGLAIAALGDDPPAALDSEHRQEVGVELRRITDPQSASKHPKKPSISHSRLLQHITFAAFTTLTSS